MNSPIASGHRTILIVFLLFGLVFGVFLPATRNAFVNFDDPEYVTENPRVQSGPTWANVKWAFTSGHAANWHPLTWVSHMIDCRLYGPKPAGHHLTSVLLHALNTTLLFLALRRMTGATGRSLAVALLFGIHPLRVESVAWIAERKDVLSGLFFMLTLIAYSEYVRRSKVRMSKSGLFYALALLAFALGLMSKPMLVTMPFVLLLLDWWPLKRFELPDSPSAHSSLQLLANSNQSSTFGSLMLEKVPFLLLAVASSVVTFAVQQSGAALAKILPFSARLENAWVSYCRYLGKLFWPADLAVYYPHVDGWSLAVVLACALTLAAVSLLTVAQSRRCPYLAVGWFWYLGMLVPVIGLVQVGTQSMADRYTYLPIVGVLQMCIWGLHHLASRRRPCEIALAALGGSAMLACVVSTHRQIGCWKDSETLFQHALAVTKDNPIARDNLGRALGERGKLDEATDQYRAALALNPKDPFACNGLGVLLMKKHDYAGAAEYLREALTLDPENAVAHYNLGIILANWGSLNEAIAHFEAAVRLKPDYAEAHNNLGGALAMSKRYDEAILHYREAIRLKPGFAIIRKNLGVALVEKGQLAEAIEEFQEAIRLQPDFAEARDKLRLALELKARANPAADRASKP